MKTPPSEATRQPALDSPQSLRRRAERLLGHRDAKRKREASLKAQIEQIREYLAIADGVTAALEALSETLFRDVLDVLQSKLTMALQDILHQRVEFHADADFKRGAAVVEFSIQREGNIEDIRRGQGGSVHNILSVGLRLFALATLDETKHRRFLVLDEQDCWLRPELVPALVKTVHQAARELGFQVLMISHHGVHLFEKYADRIFKLVPDGNRVRVVRVGGEPITRDPELETQTE